MDEGRLIQQVVKVLPFAELQSIFRSEKAQQGIGGEGDIISPEPEFGAVAGCQHYHLFDTFCFEQMQQRIVAGAFANPETLAHRDLSCTVVETDDYESRIHDPSSKCFHCANRASAMPKRALG